MRVAGSGSGLRRAKATASTPRTDLDGPFDPRALGFEGAEVRALAYARAYAQQNSREIVKALRSCEKDEVSDMGFLVANMPQRDLLALTKARGCAIVLVSHALDDVVELADRAVVLSGRPARALAEVVLDDKDPGARYRQVEALVSQGEPGEGAA